MKHFSFHHPMPSSLQSLSSLLPLHSPGASVTHAKPVRDAERIDSMKLLRKPTMPATDMLLENAVSNTFQGEKRVGRLNSAAASSRSDGSSTSRSPQQSSQPLSPTHSKTPPTSEVRPPSQPGRKRTQSLINSDEDDAEKDSTPHLCICPPDPKIPRPRNAFILYRQHHQAHVLAQNPGLANPEISKIIGEQWQNQTPEVKDKWKALAEEEKLRHQQQHPTYRYQPRRNGSRYSLSVDSSSFTGAKSTCSKCGGRSSLPPNWSHSDKNVNANNVAKPAVSTATAPHTLPSLTELSIQSPPSRRNEALAQDHMATAHGFSEDYDEMGALSPRSKRRRINDASALPRILPNRYAAAPPLAGAPVGPRTPFPFPHPHTNPYSPAEAHGRHDVLPAIRGAIHSPAAMAPPQRPITGYQQHRIAQGHVPIDRSLTLPPLQTGKAPKALYLINERGIDRDVQQQIMSMDFRYKAKILHQVAPPMPFTTTTLRGPFIAIEGDNAEFVHQLGIWLGEKLGQSGDMRVHLLDSPEVQTGGSKEKTMAAYHRLIAEWLEKTGEMLKSLIINPSSPTGSVATEGKTPTMPIPLRERSSSTDSEKLESSTRLTAAEIDHSAISEMLTPVNIIANYSLYASNHFSCQIPITAYDPYSPSDHWQWVATQWRGIMSPDLTIYVLDVPTSDVATPAVDFQHGGNLCVIRRTRAEGSDRLEIEPSTMRRLGFEVSEWIRAFGPKYTLER